MFAVSCKCFLLAFSLALGAILTISGIFALFIIPKLVNKSVYEQTYLGQDSNGTDNLVLKMFRDPPYDIRLQIWSVSVQNPSDVIKKGAKPELVEKGPYTFNVHLHKTNVSLANNRTRLFFRNNRTYHFNPNQSCSDCELTDRVTVPNILFQKIVDIAMGHPGFKPLIELIIRDKEAVFINVTVDELLFAGYEDQLIKAVCGKKILKPLCKKLMVPERIGLFCGQNGTDDGLYEVDTGISDANKLDKVMSFNGMSRNLSKTYWYKHPARMINGTDAELFRPNLVDRQRLQVFIGQLCRSFPLEARESISDLGIPVFRYAQPDSTLDVETQRSGGFCNPNSYDFFNNKSIQQAHCAPSGLLDMSSCLPGSPRIFFSCAHFCNTPEGIRHAFDGSFASPSDSDLSYFDIEPITGVIVGVQQRYQLNLGVIGGNLSMTRKMRDLIVPMVWMNESAIIDPDTRNRLLLPVHIVQWSFIGGIALIVIGSVFLVCFAGVVIGLRIAHQRQPNTDEDTHSLIPNRSGDPFLSGEEEQLPSQIPVPDGPTTPQ